MDNEINYKNNPLHGVGLKSLLNELIEQYGFEILFAYLNINCFKTNASIDSSIKFLKKTDWAREKVETFYLYEFKNLPTASDEQFLLSPRDRIIPEHQKPDEPAELSFEDADRLREKRAKKSFEYEHDRGQRSEKDYPQRGKYTKNRDNNHARGKVVDSSNQKNRAGNNKTDPWANARNRTKS